MTNATDKRTRLSMAAVINWPDLGRWVWGFLPDDGCETDLIFASQDHDAWIGRRSKLPPYLAELYYLARRHTLWNRYDVVYAWELRTILAVGLMRRLTGQRRAKFVALQPILKGSVRKLLPLIRWVLSDAARIVCFSRAECDANAELLRLPRERFLFMPLAWPETVPISQTDGGFVLAFGRSNRDYPLLLEAVRGTELPVTVLTDDSGWPKGLELPPNVTLKLNLSHDETNALLDAAKFWVVPLKLADFSSGQSVLVQGMARGKTVVITEGPGTRDYVEDGRTGILVPPNDAAALRTTLTRLWDDPETLRRIGRNAAETARRDFSFAGFARSLVSLAESLTGKQNECRSAAVMTDQ